MEELLVEIYNNPETGFVDAKTLYERAKIKDKRITHKIVKDFLNKQENYQLFKRPTRKSKNAKPQHIVAGVGAYQIDLTFLPQYKQQNKGYDILLVCINILSRKAYAIPMKNKNTTTLLHTFKDLIYQIREKDKHPLYMFESDNGSEFINKKVKTLLEYERVEQYFCRENDHKCMGMIERFNRTLKNFLTRYFHSKNTVKWIDVLPLFIRNYNNRIHSSTGMKPNDTNINDEEEIFIKTMIENAENKTTLRGIEVGTKVRIRIPKKLFQKEGQVYSTEIYTVQQLGKSTVKVASETDGVAKRVKYDDLLVIAKDTQRPTSEQATSTNNIQQAKKAHRTKRILQKEGIEKNQPIQRKQRETSKNAQIINQLLIQDEATN